jgi:hypothetical protein
MDGVVMFYDVLMWHISLKTLKGAINVVVVEI